MNRPNTLEHASPVTLWVLACRVAQNFFQEVCKEGHSPNRNTPWTKNHVTEKL